MKGWVRWGSIAGRDLTVRRGELLRYSIKYLNGLILVVDRLVCGVDFQILDL